MEKQEKKARRSVVSVIIPARNESGNITRVINEAKRIAKQVEVLVVCNGSTDQTAELAAKAGAKVINAAYSLGHDVGRAVGARYASGNILLFVDADFVVPAHILRIYAHEVAKGWDIVLNAYSGKKTSKTIHPISMAKRLLNKLAGRPDLVGSSMTTIPHAMSRKALKVIGVENLAVPPKAQVKAILNGLKIKRAYLIDTSKLNKRRIGRTEKVKELVLGDHAEAIAYLTRCKGERAGLTDMQRNRGLLRLPGASHLRWVYTSADR